MKSEKAKEHNVTYGSNMNEHGAYVESFEEEWKSHIKVKEVNHDN